MAVDVSKEAGGVGFITLDRPPANSYDLAFVEELGAAVDECARDAGVRVVAVRSASERFFSAGADIKAFTANTPDGNMEMVRTAHAVLGSIAAIPKLFVAQIAGHALGGGLEIALACDLRFGAQGEYKLGVPEATLGLLPGNGGTQRLPRLIGVSRALDLMVTGRTLSPGEAFELGILDRLVPAEQLEAETAGYCNALAAGAQRAIGSIKLAVHEGVQQPLEAGLRREQELIDALFRTEDAKEGIAAFVEKRAPEFTGS
jgi:enoyl-CoA hydratase/carnithine racemase